MPESDQATPVGTLPATSKSPKEPVRAETLDKGKEATKEKLPGPAKPLSMPKDTSKENGVA